MKLLDLGCFVDEDDAALSRRLLLDRFEFRRRLLRPDEVTDLLAGCLVELEPSRRRNANNCRRGSLRRAASARIEQRKRAPARVSKLPLVQHIPITGLGYGDFQRNAIIPFKAHFT